jgi:hypothetical protein
VTFHAIEPEGRRHDAHGVEKVVDGNALEGLNVLEDLVGHRRLCLGGGLRSERDAHHQAKDGCSGSGTFHMGSFARKSKPCRTN